MAGNNYDINYEDPRFGQVESEKSQALTELEQTYGGMIEGTEQHYNAQIDASKQWADKQSQIQQEQTDFAIEQIEQQKEQAKKDYTKEQSGAYTDWKKQSNQFGVAAEQQAAAGLTGTGFSESSQVGMYNTYQNRVASARESYNQAVLNYNNAIKDARLQNNSALAQIAFEALQQQLELSLQGFQYKNQLLLDQANQKIELDNIFHNRYLDVLDQINTEKAMAEQIRQYEQNYQLQVKEYEEGIRQFNEEIARLRENDKKAYEMEIQQLEIKKQQLEEEKRQFDLQYELSTTKSSGGGDGYYSAPQAVVADAPVVSTPKVSGHLADAMANGQVVVGADGSLKSTSKDVGLASQINNLGHGPISTGNLADMMANGEVVIGADGKLKNTSSSTKKTSVLSGLSKYFK